MNANRLSRFHFAALTALTLTVFACAFSEANDLLVINNATVPGILRYDGSTGAFAGPIGGQCPPYFAGGAFGQLSVLNGDAGRPSLL